MTNQSSKADSMFLAMMPHEMTTRHLQEACIDKEMPADSRSRWSISITFSSSKEGHVLDPMYTGPWLGEGSTKSEAKAEAYRMYYQKTGQWKQLKTRLSGSPQFVFGGKIDVPRTDHVDMWGSDVQGSSVSFQEVLKGFGVNLGTVGRIICGAVNARLQTATTLYIGAHSDGNIQGVSLTVDEWDKIVLEWDAMIQLFDPQLDGSLIDLTRYEVANGPTQTAKSDRTDARWWIIKVTSRPDPKGRLYWYNRDCFLRTQSETKKMKPPVIRKRAHDDLVRAMRAYAY